MAKIQKDDLANYVLEKLGVATAEPSLMNLLRLLGSNKATSPVANPAANPAANPTTAAPAGQGVNPMQEQMEQEYPFALGKK